MINLVLIDHLFSKRAIVPTATQATLHIDEQNLNTSSNMPMYDGFWSSFQRSNIATTATVATS